MGSGTDGIGSTMVRLASVSGGIGLPIPTLPSAKIALVSYRIESYQQLKISGFTWSIGWKVAEFETNPRVIQFPIVCQ